MSEYLTPEIIEQKIASLPRGYITVKNINGRKYQYLQWKEEGKTRNRLLSPQQVKELEPQIALRKELTQKLKSLLRTSPYVTVRDSSVNIGHKDYRCDVRLGSTLEAFIQPVLNYKKREVYSALEQYIQGDAKDKVLILYGLRRTGKTTLIRQVIAAMSEAQRNKTAFLQMGLENSMADINHDLKLLEADGYGYVFIDEVTLVEGFIQNAALLSDVFASSGIKIVLSGTDSLGFVFSKDEQLYDRCIMIHTTFIPYREFEGVLGITGIDEYIRFGGTMSRSGVNYNGTIFGSREKTEEYLNTSIAHNIQHSLKNYQYGTHFRALYSLYENGELTSAINRIVEDINHRFTLEVLIRNFKSHDLGSAKDLLLKEKEINSDVLYKVDLKNITMQLKELLEIKNKNEQVVNIEDVHRAEIKEYLGILDLICNIDVINLDDLNRRDFLTVFSQPGLRYSQAEALIQLLLKDQVFSSLSFEERKFVTEKILSDIKGRMLEEIVLLETKKARPDMQVFKLMFAVGEIDMVVADPVNGGCELYEIKYSREYNKAQVRHLLSEEKIQRVGFRYGTVTRRGLLYRGKTGIADNSIELINVEEYLKNLSIK